MAILARLTNIVQGAMACLMKFGSLPPASDPLNPTQAELESVKAKQAEYQAVFDTH